MAVVGRKLLLFIHSLQAGGAERVAAELANHWAGRQWQVTFVTVSSDATDFYRLDSSIRRISLDLAAESRGFGAALRNNFRRIRALRRALLDIRPDVAIAFMTIPNVTLALAAMGIPTLVAIGSEHVHPPCVRLHWLWGVLRRYLYGSLRAITALTTESRAWLLKNTNARMIAVVPNAVPWPLAVHAPVIAPSQVVSEGRHVLLAAGRLEEQKGFDLLIRAFEPLAATFADWDLVILGEGGLRERLTRQIAAAGLEHRVKLPGMVGNIAEWYQRADIYVFSSRFEGFGNTLAEAMAHGVPAVSFDCDTGPRDIIRHGVDGLLVPPLDVTALAHALELLMSRQDLRAQYGVRAKEIRQTLSMENVASLWERLFADALVHDSSRQGTS